MHVGERTRRSPASRHRFRASAVGLVLMLMASIFAGCHGGTRVLMDGKIDGNIATKIVTDHSADPVTQRVVGGDPRECLKVAIIDVDGVLLNRNFKGSESLGENPVSLFHEKLRAAGRDPSIRGVLLRINSPGGSVTACDLMRHDLLEFRRTTGKPVVTSVLDVGAGGAYYLATASDLIFAHPTSVVGGIGVVVNLYNMADTLEQQNIQPLPIKSGEFIDLGSPVRRMSDDGQDLLSGIAAEFHQRFRDAVSESRPDSNPNHFDGRVFTAEQARVNGFIDDVLYFDAAVSQLQQLCGVSGRSKVVMFRRANDRALTEFDVTPNTPLPLASIPISIPGLDRASLPHFLYLWQPEPGLESRGY